MMKLATATFTVTLKPLPPGVVPGDYQVMLTRQKAIVEIKTVPDETVPVSFTIETQGVYAVQVVRMDASGGQIGAGVVSAPFVVTEEMVAVPFSVSVSVSDLVAAQLPASVSVQVG